MADSSAEAIDGSTLSFLLQHALEVKRKEEEAVETAELAKLEEKVAAAEVRLLGRDPAGIGTRGSVSRLRHGTPSPEWSSSPCGGT